MQNDLDGRVSDDTAVKAENSGVNNSSTGNTFLKKAVSLALASSIATAGLASLGYFYVYPTLLTYQAQKNHAEKLEALRAGSVSSFYKGTKTFSGGVKVPGATDKQLALVKGFEGDFDNGGAVFEFYNPNSVKKSEHYLDIFMDYGTIASQDFLAINAETIKRAIKVEGLLVRIHPVPSESVNSVLVPEAIAQTVPLDNGLTWDAMVQVTRNAKGFSDSPVEEALDKIVSDLDKFGYKDKITAGSLKKGFYSSWIYKNSENDTLKLGSLPVIIFDNQPLLDEGVVLQDPNSFSKWLESKMRGE